MEASGAIDVSARGGHGITVDVAVVPEARRVAEEDRHRTGVRHLETPVCRAHAATLVQHANDRGKAQPRLVPRSGPRVWRVLPWLHLPGHEQAVASRRLDTHALLRRVDPHGECQLLFPAGREPDDEHLVGMRREHLAAELHAVGHIRRRRDGVIEPQLAAVRLRLRRRSEVQPQITEWLVRHQQLRTSHHPLAERGRFGDLPAKIRCRISSRCEAASGLV